MGGGKSLRRGKIFAQDSIFLPPLANFSCTPLLIGNKIIALRQKRPSTTEKIDYNRHYKKAQNFLNFDHTMIKHHLLESL